MARIAIESRPVRCLVSTEAGALVPRLIHAGEDYARIALVAGGALLLGGDNVEIEINVGANCTLEIEEIGGTVAYDADSVESFWNVKINLEQNSRLVWQGLPFVVSNGANVIRSSDFVLAEGAVACIRETIVLGRYGELGGRISTSSKVEIAGKLALVEELNLDGSHGVPGIIGDNRVLDTCMMFGERIDQVGTMPRVLQLEQPGSMARHIGMQTHNSVVNSLWSSWTDKVKSVA